MNENKKDVLREGVFLLPNVLFLVLGSQKAIAIAEVKRVICEISRDWRWENAKNTIFSKANTHNSRNKLQMGCVRN
jgi:hypothetical protein